MEGVMETAPCCRGVMKYENGEITVPGGEECMRVVSINLCF